MPVGLRWLPVAGAIILACMTTTSLNPAAAAATRCCRSARVAHALLLLLPLAIGCVRASATRDADAGATSPLFAKRTEGRAGMVSASQPDAAEAGALILRQGGNAMDAAAAAVFALSVTDVSQTGLGGGGALTWYDAATDRAEHLSFYARAGEDPRWAEPDTLRGDARIPARGAGTPGVVAGILESQRRFGRLTRAQVMAPAIALARDGFIVTPLLSRTIRSARERLARDSAALALFMPRGEALMPGERLVQPELAATLERIAREGRDGFYRGPVAEALSAEVRELGGLITVNDMATYSVATMRPLCAEWHGYTVLSAPPPMGGSSVIAILQMAEAAGVTDAGGFTDAPEAVVTLAGIQRAVSADGSWWRGDPAVMAVPARGFVSEGYARERAAAVGAMAPAPDTVRRGDPWSHETDAPEGVCADEPYPSATRPPAGPADDITRDPARDAESFTSHLSVVDAEGNAVSVTTTVGVLFGSGVYTGGFFLNSSGNNLDDRTRGTNRYTNSTMSPTMVLDGTDVRLVIGTAGSLYIQPSTAQVTMRILAFGEDAGLAIAAPRIQTSPVRRDVEVEPGFTSGVYAALVRAGYAPLSRVSDLAFGAVHGVHVRPDGVRVGIADPRRDGAAVAQ